MRSRMALIGAALAMMSAGAPPPALAHAELSSTDPAAGAVLATAPDEVRLVFEAELTPDGTGVTVTDPRGASVGSGALDLAVADRNEVAASVAIADSGVYRVTWTATALDLHEAAGSFTFSVAARASDAPDTAMPVRGPDLPGLGTVLVLIAGAIGLRRAGRWSR